MSLGRFPYVRFRGWRWVGLKLKPFLFLDHFFVLPFVFFGVVLVVDIYDVALGDCCWFWSLHFWRIVVICRYRSWWISRHDVFFFYEVTHSQIFLSWSTPGIFVSSSSSSSISTPGVSSWSSTLGVSIPGGSTLHLLSLLWISVLTFFQRGL